MALKKGDQKGGQKGGPPIVSQRLAFKEGGSNMAQKNHLKWRTKI